MKPTPVTPRRDYNAAERSLIARGRAEEAKVAWHRRPDVAEPRPSSERERGS